MVRSKFYTTIASMNCRRLLIGFLTTYTLSGSLLALDPILPEAIASREEICGTWAAQYGQMHQLVTFNLDGTFTGECREQGKLTDEYAGEWYLGDDDILHYTYLKSKRIPSKTKDKDKIVSLDSNSVSFLTSSRVVRNYTKIRPQGNK